MVGGGDRRNKKMVCNKVCNPFHFDYIILKNIRKSVWEGCGKVKAYPVAVIFVNRERSRKYYILCRTSPACILKSINIPRILIMINFLVHQSEITCRIGNRGGGLAVDKGGR